MTVPVEDIPEQKRDLTPDLPLDIDWGDGTPLDENIPSTIGVHQYNQSGTYLVRVVDSHNPGRVGLVEISVVKRPTITGWYPASLDANHTAEFEVLRVVGTGFLPDVEVSVDGGITWNPPNRINQEILEVAVLNSYYSSLSSIDLMVRVFRTHGAQTEAVVSQAALVPVRSSSPAAPFSDDFAGEFDSKLQYQIGPSSGSYDVPLDTADRIKVWVGDDKIKARAALDAERAGQSRPSVLTYCEAVLLA